LKRHFRRADDVALPRAADFAEEADAV
jgi:hypothetical protein